DRDDILKGDKKTLQQAFCKRRKLHHQLHSFSKESSTEFFPEIDLQRRNDQVSNDTQNRNLGSTSHLSCLMNSLTRLQHSSISTKVNYLEQTIEALKKSIDDKNLQTTQHEQKFYVLWHRLKIEEDVIILQFGSFEPVEVSTLKKTTNTSKVDDFSNKKNDDTWILVACKRQTHQGTSKLRLSKVDTKSSTNQLQQCEIIKSNTKLKYINASSQKLAHEFKCVTNEQRRRVKQDMLADFKGAFVKIRKGDKKTLQQAFCKWRKLDHQLHSFSKESSTSSSQRSTCNDEVLPDVLGDQIHLKEVYIILHSKNTLLNALESWRNLGEKNQENNRIVLTKIDQ
ncbi:hypothetical protein H5410_052795, partial [Solanum commersonii]